VLCCCCPLFQNLIFIINEDFSSVAFIIFLICKNFYLNVEGTLYKMAGKKSTAAAKKIVQSPPPTPLSNGQRRLHTLGLVVALIVFAIGGLGLLILLGTSCNVSLISTNFSTLVDLKMINLSSSFLFLTHFYF
jgi:hypothetical protein